MNTLDVKPGERVKNVHFTRDTLSVDLVDGRTITVPLAWYPRLLHATPEQRLNWRIAGAGYGIHWLGIDEDLSTEGLLRGAPAPPGSEQVTHRVSSRPKSKARRKTHA
ncbi:MAG: DUF2442 domain-containing protein [Chloroflexi bacterium]|nr:DUF2442 domain-containing protein [Chloroflexota bacterium]